MKATIIYPDGFNNPTTFQFPEFEGDLWGDCEEILQKIFRQCNHVDGTEWIAGKKLRSMSVGDIVILHEEVDIEETERVLVFTCCSCGWKKVFDNYGLNAK